MKLEQPKVDSLFWNIVAIIVLILVCIVGYYLHP